MAEEFDINKTVASFMQHNIESFFESGKDAMKMASNKVRLHLDRTYNSYMKNVLEKYSRAKSFFIRSGPVYIYDFYVPLAIRYKKGVIGQPKLSDIQKITSFGTIIGSAGSGKSMFMRHLLVNSVLAKTKVPVFIELRQFNESDYNLKQLIQQTLAINKFEPDSDYIENAMQAGHFVFFLDGFDEVSQFKRQDVAHDIQEFASTYDNNIIVLSSRPDTELESWPDFTILYLEPLKLKIACELVLKLPYDEELKRKFLKDLQSDLFNKHSSFLSNPLLLSIMLLTYGQSAHIPSKLNVFYNQAYEALFERHDALKGGYRRSRATKLDIQDFAKVFSAFCLQTYDKRKFEFMRVEALGYIEKAKAIIGIDYNKEDYLKDILQAVCLLIEDGLMIVFSHRSFQEYFTARFIAEAGPEAQKKFISKYSSNLFSDDVVRLLYELRPDIVEQYFILPKLNELFESIGVKREIGLSNYIQYIKENYEYFSLSKGEGIVSGTLRTQRKQNFSSVVLFTIQICGHLINWNGFTKNSASDNKMWDKYWNADKDDDDDGEVNIYTNNVTTTHSFFRDLSERGDFFSIQTLVDAGRIRDALNDKIREAEISLDEILGGSKSE